MATSLFLATGTGVFLAEPNGAGHEVRPVGLEGKGMVRWVLADPSRPGRVWAATERSGVWRTDDCGGSWAEKNEGLVYKHTLSLALHPRTGALYAGTEPACIFRSADGGDGWVELESLRRLGTRKDWTFPGPPYVAHVRGIGLSPADPDIVFGAVEEGWLVRSRDGGESWVNVKDGTEFDSHTVTVLPDGETVVSASGHGLYRSADGGETFARSDAGIAHPYLINVALHPDRPNVLFTAGAEVPPPGWRRPEGAGAGFYRSADAGRELDASDGRAAGAHRARAALDRGRSGLARDRVRRASTTAEIWATRDGGEGFSRIASGLPPVLGIAPVSG